jgi:hypothetical protein
LNVDVDIQLRWSSFHAGLSPANPTPADRKLATPEVRRAHDVWETGIRGDILLNDAPF